MNRGIREFLEQSDADKRGAFAAAMEEYGALPFFAEKDFWVCLVLDGLFNHNPSRNNELIFKGGTSLSKLHSLIKRFSEDIDLTMLPSQLGYEGALDPTSPDFIGSETQRKQKFDEVQNACRAYIERAIIPDLKAIFQQYGQGVSIEFEDGTEHETVLKIVYQSITEPPPGDYFTPTVRLEIGVRGGPKPKSIKLISPYISSIIQTEQKPGITIENILAIEPQRTFWEKLIIVHGQACREADGGESPAERNRLSRHYYDVAKIFQSRMGGEYLADLDLAEDVRGHCDRTYRKLWQRLDLFKPGNFNLVPKGKLIAALKSDYTNMSSMIFGDVPKFEEIIETVSEIEKRVNAFSPVATTTTQI